MSEPLVLFCTVGTTALYARDLGDADLQRLMKEHFERDGDTSFLEQSQKLRARVLDAHLAFWKELQNTPGMVLRDNIRRTSAELMSSHNLCSISTVGIGRKLRPGRDRVVFLASDNPRGRWAAEVNATVAKLVLFEGFAEKEDVAAEKVTGLEGKGVDFQEIGPCIKRIIEKYSNGFEDVRCNFTGGYKGAIPALYWACAHLPAKTSLYYQHEDMNQICRISLEPSSPDTPPIYSDEEMIL